MIQNEIAWESTLKQNLSEKWQPNWYAWLNEVGLISEDLLPENSNEVQETNMTWFDRRDLASIWRIELSPDWVTIYWIDQDWVSYTNTSWNFANWTAYQIPATAKTFAIYPATWQTSYTVYVQDIKYVKTTLESIQLTNISGQRVVMYNNTWVLEETFSPAVFDTFTWNAFVSVIYCNAITLELILFADERHGIEMDWATHYYEHFSEWARYVSWLWINWLANLSPTYTSTDSWILFDEDIINNIPAQTNSPFWYLEWTDWRISPDWLDLAYMWVTYPYYNELTLWVWSLTEITNNNYTLIHFFATNDSRYPIWKIIWQNEYASLTDARTWAHNELSNLYLLWVPTPEAKPIYTIILNDLWELVLNDTWDTFIDWRETKITWSAWVSWVTNLHSNLTDTDTDWHPASIISYNNTINWVPVANTKEALDELALWGWGGWLAVARTIYYKELNHKFNIIAWIEKWVEMNYSPQWDIKNNWQYIFFNTESNEIRKMETNTLVITTVITWAHPTWWFDIDDTHVFYRNLSDTFMHKVLFDWTWDTVINNASTLHPVASPINQNVLLYLDYNTGLQLYQINKDWTWNAQISNNAVLFEWNYNNNKQVYAWVNFVLFVSADHKLYRAEYWFAWDAQITDIMEQRYVTEVCWIWNIWYFVSNWDIWKCDLSQMPWEQLTQLTYWIEASKIKVNNWVLVYQKLNSLSEIIWKLYKLDLITLEITELVSNTIWYSLYWNEIFYINSSQVVYYIDVIIPSWYALTDWLLKLENISVPSNIITIDTKNTLPTWTNYTFELASIDIIVFDIAEWDTNLMLSGNSFIDMPNNTYVFTNFVNPWDVLTLYKTWEVNLQVVVDTVTTSVITFTTDTLTYWDSWGLKNVVNNYTLIPTSSLNWDVEINTETIFWYSATTLIARIILSTLDINYTPELNVLEIKWI
jgi:hypothetical protein